MTYIKNYTSREVLSFFKKPYIYKEKCGTVTKRKSNVKNVIINQISLAYLANILYDSIVIEI